MALLETIWSFVILKAQVEGLWFQQDRASIHRADNVLNLLYIKIYDRLISLKENRKVCT